MKQDPLIAYSSRRSARNLGHSAENYVSSAPAATPRPCPDPAASHPKGQGIAENVQVEPHGLAALQVPEATQGLPPPWGSRALGAVLATFERLIPSLEAGHYPHELDDHLLRDVGLLRDQIQPPLLVRLFTRQWRRPPDENNRR
jgi:hypothetical protein